MNKALCISSAVLSFILICLEACAQGSLEASISPDGSDTPVLVVEQEIQHVARSMLDEISTTQSINAPVSIRVSSGLGTFRAVVNCREPRQYILEIDLSMYRELKRMGDEALFFVLAHEYGHFLQYDSSPQLVRDVCAQNVRNIRTLELMADFAAGHIMFNAYGNENRLSLLRLISGLADYEFSNIEHHGTVTDRNSAYGMGGFAAYYRMPLDMARLIDNTERFESLLYNGVPRQSGRDQEAVFKSNIEALYE